MSYKDPLEIAIDIRKFAIVEAIRYWEGQGGSSDDLISVAVDIENYLVTGQVPVQPDRDPEEAKQYNPPWQGTPQSIYSQWFDLGGK
jgi:hypothetical protein